MKKSNEVGKVSRATLTSIPNGMIDTNKTTASFCAVQKPIWLEEKIAPGRSRIRVIFDNVQSSNGLNVNKSGIHENTGSRTYVASNTTSICSWANYSIKIRLEIQNSDDY